ncbi:MAG: hypothetical protein H6737_05545 [Alphaproteobacteria bacterium]|nr:hypothetical protein [Alphaproteobacteria bacterium]
MLALFSLFVASATIPDDHSVGFGLGIAAPTGTFAPNTVSVRVKAMDTLVVEPSLDSSFASSGSSADIGGTEIRSRTTSVTFGGGLALRYHVASRDPVALVFTMTPYARFAQTFQDPNLDGADDVTTNSSFTTGAAWGLGTSYHPGGPWQISADVSNPLVAYTRSSTRQPNDDVQATGTFDVGLVFAPSVRMMAHLWF